MSDKISSFFSNNTSSTIFACSFNGSKNGGRGANGILGNSHTSGTGGIGFEGANPIGNGHTRMHHLSWWNCELPDSEITKQYNYLKSVYNLV